MEDLMFDRFSAKENKEEISPKIITIYIFFLRCIDVYNKLVYTP